MKLKKTYKADEFGAEEDEAGDEDGEAEDENEQAEQVLDEMNIGGIVLQFDSDDDDDSVMCVDGSNESGVSVPSS